MAYAHIHDPGIGRNAPCPCGSDRKYKKCCLAAQRAARQAATDAQRFSRSIDSLIDRCTEWLVASPVTGDDLERWVRGLLGPADAEPFLHDPPRDRAALTILAWVDHQIVEGVARIDGVEHAVADLMTGRHRVEGWPRPARLDDEERAVLDRWRSAPLRIYRIDEVLPGQGAWVRDELSERPPGPRTRVTGRPSGRRLQPGQLVAARLVEGVDGEAAFATSWIVSGDRLWQAFDDLDELDDPTDREIADCSRRAWMRSQLATPRPEIVREPGGHRAEFVLHHFEVLDWPALERTLDEHSQCNGRRRTGWVLAEDLGDGRGWLRWSIDESRRAADRVELFGRNRRLADEGHAWLELVAGGAVRYRLTEPVDPGAALALGGEREGLERIPDRLVTFDELREFTEQFYRQYYADLFDYPLPALRGRTPAEVLGTRGGRRRVEAVIRDCEAHERRLAEEEGREPIGFTFLRSELERRLAATSRA